jgi:hypothetical protein
VLEIEQLASTIHEVALPISHFDREGDDILDWEISRE